MSEVTNRALRGGVRAVVGVVVIGLAATFAVLVGAGPLPAVERAPVSLTVDAQHGAARPFVCSGAFAELGADSSRPSVAIPGGEARVTTSGDFSRVTELGREEAGGSAPEVQWVAAGEPFAAAQSQEVVTASLKGTVASSCVEPANEQWLVGGATIVGSSTTLVLGNPAPVPATVQLALYDEKGAIDSAAITGVLVPANSQRVVSMNGYAPGRNSLVVRVESTGAAVSASLGIGAVTGLQPIAVDTVTRQLAPNTSLIVPGVANLGDDHHGPGDAGKLDEFPVIVRALSTTGEPGTAKVTALLSDGSQEDLGSFELEGHLVADMPVAHWPEGANAAIITSTVPIVGGVLGQAAGAEDHDYAWFSPAPPLPVDTDVAVAAVEGGQLVLANPDADDAEITLSSAVGQDQHLTVPAGAAIAVLVSDDASMRSSVPIYAAVRLTGDGTLAGYPVLAEPERESELTVYPR